MSIFSALFGKKKDETPAVKPSVSKPAKATTEATPSLHLRGKADANGLYPSELVMLAVAERYKTTETNFSDYFMRKYEIINPLKMLKSLQARGFIQIGSPIDMLPSLKVAELKEIAAGIGLEVKGKKADIVAALSEVPPDKIDGFIKERKWKLTDLGQAALKQNPYVQYFLDGHEYDVTMVGVTIWTVNEDFVKDTKRPYRDVFYRQLNDRMNEACIAFQRNPMSGTANTYQYCECYRLMGLFIEEEGKSHINASDLYFQYIYKWINIHEGMRLLLSYKLWHNDKAHQKELLEHFYEDIKLAPYQRTELLRLIDKLELNGEALRKSLITSFERAEDTGIMTPKETADFVIYELSGEMEKSMDIANKLAKKAVKRI